MTPIDALLAIHKSCNEKCFSPCCSWKIPNSEVLGLRMGRNGQMERSISIGPVLDCEQSLYCSKIRGEKGHITLARSCCFVVHVILSLNFSLRIFEQKRETARSLRPVQPRKVVHLERWTDFFETFVVEPNRSIQF